MVTNMFTS